MKRADIKNDIKSDVN